MNEWSVVGVIVALVGLVSAVAAPLVKLNGNITRLTVTIEGFRRSLEKLDGENRTSHKAFYARLEGHDRMLAEHEQRLRTLENRKGA